MFGLSVQRVGARQIASKHIDVGAFSAKEKEDIDRDVAVIQGLKHERIVTIHSFAQLDGTLVVSMEYMAGGDLSKMISDRKTSLRHFDDATIISYMGQLLLGLSFLHERSVVHRNLKPENVLFDQSLATLKITDIGVRALLVNLPSAKQTLFYLSPEVIQQGHGDRSSDVWSLGVIGYEMSQLDLPFKAMNSIKLKAIICAGKYEEMTETRNDALKRIVRHMISKEPTERPECDELLEGEPFQLAVVKRARNSRRSFKSVTIDVQRRLSAIPPSSHYENASGFRHSLPVVPPRKPRTGSLLSKQNLVVVGTVPSADCCVRTWTYNGAPKEWTETGTPVRASWDSCVVPTGAGGAVVVDSVNRRCFLTEHVLDRPWTEIPPPVKQRSWAKGVVKGEELLLIGGWWDDEYVATVEQLSLKDRQWRVIAALKQPSMDAAVCVSPASGRVLVIGGQTNERLDDKEKRRDYLRCVQYKASEKDEWALEDRVISDGNDQGLSACFYEDDLFLRLSDELVRLDQDSMQTERLVAFPDDAGSDSMCKWNDSVAISLRNHVCLVHPKQAFEKEPLPPLPADVFRSCLLSF